MKCAACGCEKEAEDWKCLQIVEDVCLDYSDFNTTLSRDIDYNYIYACPECGTLKVRI